MKISITILSLVLCFECLANPIGRTHLKQSPLKGKVKTIKQCGYGALTEAEAATIGFTLDFYSIDSFGENGQKLISHRIVKGDTGDIIYQYDSNGRLLKTISDETWYFLYDNFGNLIEERSQFDLYSKSVFYYYKDRRLLAKQCFDEISCYIYDDSNRLVIESIRSTGYGWDIEYTYDFNGRLATETQLAGREIIKTTYTYDDHDNEISAIENTNSGLQIRTFLTDYLYDKYGNWTRRVTDSPNDVPDDPQLKEVEIREIEYYEE